MSRPSVNEGNQQTHEDRSTQTGADEDGWLVRGLVFSLRLFLVLAVSFARAVVIVAGDNFPDAHFHPVIPIASDPSSSLQTRSSNLGSLEALPAGTVSTAPQGYYVIFIGRQVGYTTSSTLMTSLVHGIPNNYSRRYDTFDEAVQAYTAAVQHGNIRRVRTVVQTSGRLEYVYDYIGFAAGIRNLDSPHEAPLPLTPADFPSDLRPPTPSNSQTCADPRNGTDSTRVSSVSSVSSTVESGGLVVPVGCSTLNAQERSADTVIISDDSVLSVPTNDSATVRGTATVLLLDSDEDTPNSSIMVNSVASVHSAHSSDIYYTDKRYDIAFAAYIEEEDSNAVGVEDASVAVQTE